MENQSCLAVWAAKEPSHPQGIGHDLAGDLLTQRPTYDPAAEQVKDHGQETVSPHRLGCMSRPPTHTWLNPATVKLRSRRLGAIGRPCRLSVVVIRKRRLPRAWMPLRCISCCTGSFAYADALSPQFPPDTRPAVGSPILLLTGVDMNQQNQQHIVNEHNERQLALRRKHSSGFIQQEQTVMLDSTPRKSEMLPHASEYKDFAHCKSYSRRSHPCEMQC